MTKFLCMTANGTYPPKFVHPTLGEAIKEGRRLAEQFNTSVKILEVVAEVERVEVPVTRLETQVKFNAKENVFF